MSLSPAKVESDYADRREFIRVPMQSRVRAVSIDLSDSKMLRLVDISPMGARLSLDAEETTEKSFYIIMRRRDGHLQRILCERRWQVGVALGVRFSEPLTDEVFSKIVQAEYPDKEENFPIS